MRYDDSIPPMPIAPVKIHCADGQIRANVTALLQFDTRATVTILPNNCIAQLRSSLRGMQKVRVEWYNECAQVPIQQLGYWVQIEFPEFGFISPPTRIITDDSSIGKIGRDLMQLLKVELDGKQRQWRLLDVE